MLGNQCYLVTFHSNRDQGPIPMNLLIVLTKPHILRKWSLWLGNTCISLIHAYGQSIETMQIVEKDHFLDGRCLWRLGGLQILGTSRIQD